MSEEKTPVAVIAEKLLDAAWEALSATQTLETQCKRRWGTSRPALLNHLVRARSELDTIHNLLERDVNEET